MASKPSGSSRLLVKIANGLEKFGPKRFEKRLDLALDGGNTNGTVKFNHISEARIAFIFRIVGKELSLTAKEIKLGKKNDNCRFAICLVVKLMQEHTEWKNAKIADYFGRARAFVYRCNEYIAAFDPNNRFDKPKIEKMKVISEIINNEFSKK